MQAVANCPSLGLLCEQEGVSSQDGEILMASRLNPYLNFDGNARQAMEFYQGVFGGELELNTYAEFAPPGEADGAPEGDKIMHGMLESPSGFTVMGADNPPGTPFTPAGNITVSLSGDDVDELRGYWAKLTEGGEISVPLEKQMWGDEFGMAVDKFGIAWMVNISSPEA